MMIYEAISNIDWEKINPEAPFGVKNRFEKRFKITGVIQQKKSLEKQL